jgi:hypothetical protein
MTHRRRPAAEAKTSGSGSTRTPSGQIRLFTIAGVLRGLAPNGRLLVARSTGAPHRLQVPPRAGSFRVHWDPQYHLQALQSRATSPAVAIGPVTGAGGFDSNPPGALPGRSHASLPRLVRPLGSSPRPLGRVVLCEDEPKRWRDASRGKASSVPIVTCDPRRCGWARVVRKSSYDVALRPSATFITAVRCAAYVEVAWNLS